MTPLVMFSYRTNYRNLQQIREDNTNREQLLFQLRASSCRGESLGQAVRERLGRWCTTVQGGFYPAAQKSFVAQAGLKLHPERKFQFTLAKIKPVTTNACQTQVKM